MEASRKPLSGNGITLYLAWTAVFCVQTAIAISFQNQERYEPRGDP